MSIKCDIKTLHDISRGFLTEWLQILPSFIGFLTPTTSIFPGIGPHRKCPTKHIDPATATRLINAIGNQVGLEVSPERLQLTHSHFVHDGSGQDLLRTANLLGLKTLDNTFRRISLYSRNYQARQGKSTSHIGTPLSSDEVKLFWAAVLELSGPTAARERLLASLWLWDGFGRIQALELRYRDVMEQGVVRRAIPVRPLQRKVS
jgi:hypothetical protein